MEKDASCQVVRVYRSLDQILDVLTSPKNFDYPQVKQLLEVASSRNLIKKSLDGKYVATASSLLPASFQRDDKLPFIVIEGLDGSGKTTLTELLRTTFGFQRLETPPEYIKTVDEVNIRAFFDAQPETLKRAYYGMGNYLVSKDVLELKEPIVMDRFWHSTTAYAFANFIKSCSGDSYGDSCYEHEDLSWPTDLVQPNLVLFLAVSEEERLRRHQTRANFTNTREEEIIATDPMFRVNLKNCYKKISGVRFIEFNCDYPKEVTCEKLIQLVSEIFPNLKAQ